MKRFSYRFGMLCDMPCECGIPEQGPLLWRQISQLNQLTAEALRQNVLLTRLGSDSGLSSSKAQEKLRYSRPWRRQGMKPRRAALGLLELSSSAGQTFLSAVS